MKKNVVITLSDEYIDKVKSIAESLTQEGLNVQDVFEFGIITGQLEEETIEKIKNRPEILELSEDKKRRYIDPPSSDIL